MNQDEGMTDNDIRAVFERRAARAHRGDLRESILRATAHSQRRAGWRTVTTPRGIFGMFTPTRLAMATAAVLLVAVLGVAFLARPSGLVGPGVDSEPSRSSAEPSPSTGSGSTYEAVFLRRDPSTDVLVIGVDSGGRERVITRLAKVWGNFDTRAPAGVVSSSGRLAMPAGVGIVRWTVFDLLHPEATPIVIAGLSPLDNDHLEYLYPIDPRSDAPHWRHARAWWGPGDRLAIRWYERFPQGDNTNGPNWFVTFADGATGESTSVDIPDDLTFLPFWAPDGSGILVETGSGRQVLRADGSMAPPSDVVPEASCERYSEAGSDVDDESTDACLSPDDSLIARSSESYEYPTGSLTVRATGESFDVVGRFAGWLDNSNVER